MIDQTIVLAQIAQATPEPSVETSGPLGVVVVGFLFVVVVLVLLSSVTAAMGAWFSKQAARAAAKSAEAARQAAETSAKASPAATLPGTGPSAEEGGEDPALVAVIAAAVHTVFGDRPHRVVSVRSAGPGWAQEGRRQIFSSHRVR